MKKHAKLIFSRSHSFAVGHRVVGLALALLTGGIRGEHRRHVPFGQRRTLVQRHVDDGRLEGSSAANRLRERLLLGLLVLGEGAEEWDLLSLLGGLLLFGLGLQQMQSLSILL